MTKDATSPVAILRWITNSKIKKNYHAVFWLDYILLPEILKWSNRGNVVQNVYDMFIFPAELSLSIVTQY